ncbi:MAG: ABC transporter permease [Alistipes sp.]|nr:ABC transporter permease [Alistipes sp.]
MDYIRAFWRVFLREITTFGNHKVFYRLSLGLPILSFLFFVILFRSGVPRDIPIAILDQDHSALSRQLSRMLDATPSAQVAYHIEGLAEGEKMMKEGKIDAIVAIPRDMEKDIYSNRQAQVLAYINDINLTKNGLLNKDLQTAVHTFSSGVQIQTLVKKGLSEKEAYDQMMPVYFEKHVLFNPYINYGYYLVPCFMPVMLLIFTLLTTVFTIGVELKNGTAPQWFSTAEGHTLVALAGKLTPYTVIFFALCMLMNTLLFKFLGVPFNGNTTLFFISGLVFVLAYQAIGVAIIVLLSNLRLSLSIGGGYSVLAFTFSGLTFPFMAMDLPLRIAGYFFPLTYYVDIFIDQGMRGAPINYSMHYLGYMALFLLLPLLLQRRVRRVCTEPKFWGKL